MDFAASKLGYRHEKGLDFIARVKGHYIIGEAKFLSANGGNQNGQLNDALSILDAKANAIKIAILDGVCYLSSNNKMFRTITQNYGEQNVMSALLLRNFLYSIS